MAATAQYFGWRRFGIVHVDDAFGWAGLDLLHLEPMAVASIHKLPRRLGADAADIAGEVRGRHRGHTKRPEAIMT